MATAEPRPSALLALTGGLLLLWPTAMNWHPYLFWDTYGYFLQGKAYATLTLAGLGLVAPPPEVGEGWLGAAGRMLAHDPSIRSPTYSLLLYGLSALGNFWLVAWVTAVVATGTLEVVLVRLFGLTARQRLATLALLALATSLPWFASYLMPDLFAGLLLLSVAALAFAWERLRPGERLGLLALTALAASFHSTHLLLGAGLTALGSLLAGSGSRLATAARLGPPIALAIGLLATASLIGFQRPSLAPSAPPFLLARSWEDGPARLYLEASCGRESWAICAHLASLAPTAQEFLWRESGSYWALDAATRAAIRAEEMKILRRALMAHPFLQIRASLRNILEQLVRVSLDDLVLGRGALVTPEDYTFLYQPLAPAKVWGLDRFSRLGYASTIAACLILVCWYARHQGHPLTRPVLLVALGVLLNAALCGALSGPHDRYQARVIWTLPLLAFALAVRQSGPDRTRARSDLSSASSPRRDLSRRRVSSGSARAGVTRGSTGAAGAGGGGDAAGGVVGSAPSTGPR